MIAIVAILVGAMLVGVVLAAIFCALGIIMFCTLHLQRNDQREIVWQRLSARQALRDFQQREHEEGRGPTPIEPELTPGEKIELSSLNQWAMAREARSQPGPPEDEAAAARREAESSRRQS